MRDLISFGTAEYPLRCSALPLLIRCPLRAVLLHMRYATDSSGKAADTGSAAHKAVAVWHTNGRKYAAAVKAMKEALADYPLADLHEAELHFRPYTEDPRNQTAEVVAVEQKVSFTLDPAENDPTGELIHCTGTLDQLRSEGGRVFLWDVKTGMSEGWEMSHDHALQVAAYAVGAGVEPGGVIRTRGYRKRGVKAAEAPPGVFWPALFDRAGADVLLGGVRAVVARVRAGGGWAGPGDWCGYCPAGGLELCVPKLKSLTVVK